MDNNITESEQMMQHRTELLLGHEGLDKLQTSRVLIFGLGGVGSWCAESLVRSGVRNLTIVDSDRISITNCNRQLMATPNTAGRVKVEVMRERLLDINPNASITALAKVYDANSADSFHMEEYDFIVDAIDSLRDKADLILHATSLPKNVTFISSMGAALRNDPFMIRKAEFWKVKGDPLARALRDRFKKQKLFPKRKFLCVYSEEPPMKNKSVERDEVQEGYAVKAQPNGSLCHITASFGMAITGIIIMHIMNNVS